MLKTWQVPTHNPNNPILKISGETLIEAINTRINDLAWTVKPDSEHILSLPENAHIEYSKGVFGGTGGVRVLLDCKVSTAHVKGSPNYREYPKQYEVWVHANPEDIN